MTEIEMRMLDDDIRRLNNKIKFEKFKKHCGHAVAIIFIITVLALLLININYAAACQMQQTDMLDQIMALRMETEQAAKSEIEPTIIYNIPLTMEQQAYVKDVAVYYEVPPELLFAVMQIESGYDVEAYNNGNIGIMQINAAANSNLTEQLLLSELTSFEDNVMVGTYKLSCALQNTDTLDQALMVYNLGTSGAQRYWDKGIYKTDYSQKVLATAFEIYEERKLK